MINEDALNSLHYLVDDLETVSEQILDVGQEIPELKEMLTLWYEQIQEYRQVIKPKILKYKREMENENRN